MAPPQCKLAAEHQGIQSLSGVSEGAIVRAANGDLVAALRTDVPPRYFAGPHDDSLEGTTISISVEDGRTWSDLHFLFVAGRHHANLQRLPGGDLVGTLIIRDDIRDSKLAGHRRGRRAHQPRSRPDLGPGSPVRVLDRFDFLREEGYWVDGQCGHVATVALEHGNILSAYGQYLLGATVLIRWKPDAGPVEQVPSVGIQIRPERR